MEPIKEKKKQHMAQAGADFFGGSSTRDDIPYTVGGAVMVNSAVLNKVRALLARRRLRVNPKTGWLKGAGRTRPELERPRRVLARGFLRRTTVCACISFLVIVCLDHTP